MLHWLLRSLQQPPFLSISNSLVSQSSCNPNNSQCHVVVKVDVTRRRNCQGIAGGVAALTLKAGPSFHALTVRRRQRRDDLAGEEPRSQMTVTPFNPTLAMTTPLDRTSPAWTTSDDPSEPTLSITPIAAPISVGLTSKELARQRSVPMVSVPSHALARSSSSGSQPTSPPTISASTTDRATTTATPETWRL